MKNLLLILALVFTNSLFALNCNSIIDGDWNNPLTWSCGVVPSPGDTITISAGTIVTVSINTNLNGAPVLIIIDGILLFDSPGAKLRLECGSIIMITPTGEIRDSGNGTPSHSIRICGVDVWTGTDGSVFGPLIIGGSPLAIELVNFTVESDRDLLSFEWTTATETNNDFFSIEASSDNQNWISLGTVNGAGNSSQELNYSFETFNQNNAIYFRLKQTDFDGKSSLSNIIALKNDSSLEFSIYPNPATDNRLTIQTAAVGNYNLIICNSSGSTIYEMRDINSSIVTLDNLELNKGVYFVRIENKSETKLMKLIKN